MCDCSRCSLGTLRRGSQCRRRKCWRSSGRGHCGRRDRCDRSIMSTRRRWRSVFRGDRGVVRVGACSTGRRARVDKHSADTAGPASKARGCTSPLKPCFGHGFRTLLSHHLLPLALASHSPCSFASAAPPLLAFPTRLRLHRRDVDLDALQRVPRAAPPSR
jgi:hypothetical protein